MEEHPEVPARTSFARIAKLGVALALTLAVGFAGGVTVGAAGKSQVVNIPLLGDGLDATPDEEADLEDFWKAWNALETRFVEANASSSLPSAEERVWGAIQGLAQAYGDPYTVFMPPVEAQQFQDDIKGEFSGVGMEVGVKEGILTVIAPLKNTPAERAGLRAGDLIITIDGEPTDGLSTDEAVTRIRGEKGTTVTFRIIRDGAPLEIPVVRDTIQVPTIDATLDAQSGVFVISLYSFTANSDRLFSNALAQFRASGSDKLLIDLRSNPGGYLEAAVSIASDFLPAGTVVVTEDFDGKEEAKVQRSRGTGGAPDSARVAILIDQGSASASEILAGALQDTDRATLVGANSFGKGSVQQLVDIDDGALKVTIARWLTPSGKSISDGGLTPDIAVPYTPEDRDAGRDPQKARAIEFLATGR